MSIRKKIFIPMILLTITCGVAVLISSILLFNRELNSSMRNKIAVAQSIIDVEIEDLLNKALLTASAMRVHQNLSEALADDDFERVAAIANSLKNMAHLDFCTVVDRDGTVIVRVHDPGNYGDSLMGLSHVQSAFDNKVESFIVPGVTIRLGVMAGAPIYDLEENIVGATSLGFRLDSQTFVQKMSYLTECEVSVYLKDELVSSTILNDDSDFLLGRTADESISEKVLAGESFTGRVRISGRNLLSTYTPIYGINNEVVGMMFVGYDTAEATRDTLLFILTGVLVTLFVLVLCIVLARYISKVIDERLNKAHRHTAQFLEYMDTMIIVTGIESDKILYLNERFKKEFGFTDSVLGKECWDIIVDGTSGRCGFCPKNNMDTSSEETVSWEFFNPKTKRNYRIISKFIDWIDDSRVFVEQCIDITEVREREAELERINEANELHLIKLNTVIKAAEIALWDGEIPEGEAVTPDTPVSWSDEFREILGFSDKNDFPDVFGSFVTALHPEDRERVLNAFANHLYDKTGNTPFSTEYRLLKKNGDYAYFQAAGSAIRNENGDAVRVAGAIMDITEKMNLQHNLEYERSTLQLMFDSIPDHIFCKDKDFKYTRCNEALLKYHGLKKEDLLGKDDRNGLRVSESVAAEYRLADSAVITEHEAFVYEDKIPGADGHERFFETNKVPLIIDGKAVGVMGVARDITQRKAMEEATQSANRSKSVFLATMSHEIRTPMNSIIGFSELAQSDEIPDKTRTYLHNIQDSAEWLLNIVNDILDISKIESGKIVLENIPFHLPDIFAHCQSAIMPKIDEKGIMLYCYAEPSIGKRLLGDPIRLRQIIMNLLSNAVKFTNSGTVKFLASISSADEDSVTIQFEIKDSGIGMTAEQIDRIFNPFTQAEDSITRRFGGTGLGLTITKNIVELMGGTLCVESAPGVGSRFTFELKFDLIDDSDIPKDKIVLSDFEKPNFEGEVLICEDNTLNQQVISDHLSRVGLRTVVADNGKDGVDIIAKRIREKEKPFDLIIMDIHMPVMDGLDAAKIITDMGINTPIVALTANIMSNDIEHYNSCGMYDTVGKPFTAQELWRCLAKYLPVKSFTAIDKHRATAEESKTQKMIKTNFVKNNQTTYDDIISAVNSGDIKLAHRLAHTLKSNAAQLENKSLQTVAAKIEASLADGKTRLTKKDSKNLKKELESALAGLTPLLNGVSATDKTESFDTKKALEIFDILKPLLQSNNTTSIKYINQLYSIPDTEQLIAQIEGFKLREALTTLEELRKDLISEDE